jgi:hypothetical protein
MAVTQRTCLVVASLLLLANPAFAQLSRDTAITKAEGILRNFQDGKAEDIVSELDARMSKELTADKIRAAWTGVVAQAGAFKGIVERREGQVKDRQAVELLLAFEKETIVQRVVFDRDGRIAGLVFRPPSASLLPSRK